MRKVLHLEIKLTGEHKYYGSLVALCSDNEHIIKKERYHTLKRISFDKHYITDTYIIRKGSVLTKSIILNY
ncbi:hypothetical protein D3C71_344030 [compost metagenome]